ncbi:probable glycerol-3-phosphate acyltransferase 8 [Aristolochia californica]|uniref:probable glycerol-3-phosphate acyltransferase 8 n=1 Tax=Aristolochia californica TaxID=171875 RepID=UPI0035D8A38E
MAGARRSFLGICYCDPKGREEQTVVADLDGAVFFSRSSFPYFFLVAIEAGSFLRGAFLLLLYPLICFLRSFVSGSLATQMMIFVSMSGLKIRDIQLVAKAVLPKFYASDVREDAWRVIGACKRRILVTSDPIIMVEPFAVEFLRANAVVGTEIEVNRWTGRATGLVKSPGVVAGELKVRAVERVLCGELADLAIGNGESDYDFTAICKECYMVHPDPSAAVVPPDCLNKPIIFHDGRLIERPTPINALIVYIWLPFGFLLALVRVHLHSFLPIHLVIPIYHRIGVHVIVHGTPPPPPSPNSPGSMFVCNHRTLLDAVMIHVALKRKVSTVTYSLGRMSELLSPIPLVRLTRHRPTDRRLISSFLNSGDLIICPEGTTCRERYLLRFSQLFAELSDRIVPVAIESRQSMFHGNTARGWKSLDVYFFFMNPRVRYEVTILDGLPGEWTYKSGTPAIDIANQVQQLLGATLGFQCTVLTRKDKYMALSGNDGRVEAAVSSIKVAL